jgi:hypothetical protein
MELVISLVSLAISLLTLGFLYRQIRESSKATKTQISVNLIDQLYSDKLVQDLLELVIQDKLSFRIDDDVALITSKEDSVEKDVYLELNILLNRFQVLGHSFHLRVLNEDDLRGIRYEIIKLGRNTAIREYLYFLNTEYQNSSGISHDHFAGLKEMYLAFEYDPNQRAEFGRIPKIPM